MFRHVIQLPFILRLREDQVFPLQVKDAAVTIRFKTPPRNEKKPLTYTLLVIDSTKDLNHESLWALEAYARVNEIIRAYQVVTGDIYNNGIISPLTWNQFNCNILFGEIDEKGLPKEEPKYLIYFLGLDAKNVDQTKYEELRALSESPAKMSERALEELLIQAKIFLEQHNFRMAIIESVIALEFVLSSMVRKYSIDKGMSREKTEGIIFKLGIAGILDSLTLFSNEEIPSNEIVTACRKANSVRNDIVHRAILNVTMEEARNALMAIEAFAHHFNLLGSHF